MRQLNHWFFLITVGVLFYSVNDIWAVSGTKGVPLGGIGTGYVKFDAATGDFATSSRVPPPGGDMVSEFDSKASISSGFHFFVGSQSVKKAKTNKEDAKLPLYTADFGNKNNVSFSLKAFGPVIPALDDPVNYKLAVSPMALFEVTAKNIGSEAIDVAVALEFANKSTGTNGLLGGKGDGELDPEAGNKGIFFRDDNFNDNTGNPNNRGNAYLLVGCSNENSSYSAGSMGNFLTTGVLANNNGNCVAAKCNVGAGDSVNFRFIISWWRTLISGKARYKTSPEKDEDNYYYHNYYNNSKEVALFGMENFDRVRNGIVSMVNRVMASNFPEWYKDRLLNNCYPLIQNSLWTKDGRAAYWEGEYPIIGTIDQAQHASIWYIHNWPHNQWLEMQYWIRNMWRNPNIWSKDVLGQIHHDFNAAPQGSFDIDPQYPGTARFIAPWDDYDRQDYFWDRDATDWSDLNAMLLFKAYELMVVTGCVDSISKWYPKLLLTAERLIKMSQEAGSSIPITSSSSYDSDHTFQFSEYSSGTAVVAYKVMEEIASILGDEATASKYREMYLKGKKEYRDKFFTPEFGTQGGLGRLWQEGNVGGYCWSNYFCLEPSMDSAFITTGCNNIWNKYMSESDIKRKLGGWHLYTYDHFGGALTAIKKPDSALYMHKLNYDLYYKNLPQLVFWQTLFTSNAESKYSSYMTAPNVWRSYFQFMGYLLDKATNRLWIRPSLPSEMNKKIINAALPNPSGWGTLNYDENVSALNDSTSMVQSIKISYDSPVIVKEVVLKNNTNSSAPFVFMTVGGSAVDVTTTTEDWGIEKNLRVRIAAPVSIGPDGAEIKVYTRYSPDLVLKDQLKSIKTPISILTSSLKRNSKIVYFIDHKGEVTMELLHPNGSKAGTIMKEYIPKAGMHSFVWKGNTVEGKTIKATNVYILRLKTPTRTVSRVVYCNFNK